MVSFSLMLPLKELFNIGCRIRNINMFLENIKRKLEL